MSASTTTNGNGSPTDRFQPWLDFWTQSIEHSMEGRDAPLKSMPTAGDLHALRRRWLGTLAQSMDGQLRSPSLPEGMPSSMEAVTEIKKRWRRRWPTWPAMPPRS